MLCDSCEKERPTHRYVIVDDLHGRKNVLVDWCDECRDAHTLGLSHPCCSVDALLGVAPQKRQRELL